MQLTRTSLYVRGPILVRVLERVSHCTFCSCRVGR